MTINPKDFGLTPEQIATSQRLAKEMEAKAAFEARMLLVRRFMVAYAASPGRSPHEIANAAEELADQFEIIEEREKADLDYILQRIRA